MKLTIFCNQMTIRESYNIEESLNTFSFFPNKSSVRQSRWLLLGILLGLIFLFIFENNLDKIWRWIIYIFMVYFFLHSIYDIQIRSKIQYSFDVHNNAVYKVSPLFSKKKIMKLEEAVVFVNSEMGSWYYALGASRSQFVKNYRISETFSSGRKSDQRQNQYEAFVLSKIDKLINSVHEKKND